MPMTQKELLAEQLATAEKDLAFLKEEQAFDVEIWGNAQPHDVEHLANFEKFVAKLRKQAATRAVGEMALKPPAVRAAKGT